jgi:PAS domain-containing protein
VNVKVPDTQNEEEPARSHVAEPGAASPATLESFRSALEAGQVGVWSWDLRSHHMTWSTRLEDFHGLSENSVDGSLSIVPQDFPSQDAAGVFAAIHKTLQTREPCRLEYRLPGRSDWSR